MDLTRRSTLAGAVAAAGIALAATSAVADEPEGKEKHPQIRRAIRSLEEAKDYMQHAAHDFGGHREAALHECDEAIKQLREALKFDKT